MKQTHFPPSNTSSLMRIWNICCLRILARIGFAPSSRMQSFLKTAAAASSSEHDREMISFWAVDSIYEPENDLSELASPRNRFLRRILSENMKRSMWEGFVSRAPTLNSPHVLDHFTAVTGHSIDDVATCMEGGMPGDPASREAKQSVQIEKPSIQQFPQAAAIASQRPGSVVSIEAQHALGLASFRSEKRISSPRRHVRHVGMQALASAFGVYLMLIMAGSWKPVVDVSTMPKHLPDYSWIELGSHPRGRFIEPNLEVSERYRTAVTKLQRANTSVFGYLPGMNRDLLNEGIMEMESAIAFHQAMGYLYPQALMLLADAYVRAGQPHKAVPLLDQIIEVNAKKAPEARQLRSRLHKKGLYR